MQDALTNLLSPPVLFFFLGLWAALLRSDLEFPARVAKALALYLLLAIGYSGGVELASEGFTRQAATILLSSLLLAFLLPLGVFFFLRHKFGRADAAAIAATYGSVSAVTFIAAMAFLQKLDIPFSGAMIAAMALMESPAILVGLWLAKGKGLPWRMLLREAVFNGSVVLLLGSLLIGMVSTSAAVDSLKPFVKGIFPGLLCLFLLDMGLLCGKRFGDLWRAGAKAVVPALIFPPVHAAFAVLLARVLQFSEGDALLLAVLAGSASYIAVPAAMRVALPESNPGIYVPMALAVTFPFNIIIGIPLYLNFIQYLWTI
jgi:hypothetical protein